MAKYRLTGENHNVKQADGSIRKAERGEVIELTPAQAKNFADKFEPLVPPAPAQDEDEDEDKD